MAEASAPSLLDRYVAAVLRHRWPVVALATVLMLAMTAGAPSITVTNDYRILFSDDNPQLIAYNALENTYAVSNRALIAVAPRDGSVFTQETLGSIVELTDAAWQAPYSSRVDSLTNYSPQRGGRRGRPDRRPARRGCQRAERCRSGQDRGDRAGRGQTLPAA